jgi:hypothetical protein
MNGLPSARSSQFSPTPAAQYGDACTIDGVDHDFTTAAEAVD